MINYSPLSTTCGITVGGTGLSTITGQLYVGSTTDYFGSSTVIQLISGASNKNVGIRSNILYLYSYNNGSTAQLVFGDGSANFGLFSNDTEFALYNYGTASNSITVNRATNAATFAGEISQIYNPGNTGAFQYLKNANSGNAAYVSKKWQNDDAGFGEIWRNSSTRSTTGQGALSFNMYNSADINFWAGGGNTLNLSGTNATFAGDVTVNGSHLTLANGTTSAAATDYLYIGGAGLASADAAIYIGNGGGNTTDGYGYRIYYSGTGSGNNNKSIFKSENYQSAEIDMLTFTADGKSTFSQDVGIGTDSPTANLHVQGSSATDAPIVRVGGYGNSGSTLELAETLTSGNMTYGFSFEQTGNGTNELLIKRHNNSAGGTPVITLSRTNDNVSMSGGLSLALKATSSSTLSTDGGTTLTTKNYVDALAPGAGVFLPLAGGTMTGDLNLTYAYPRINLTDTNHNSDYSIINNDGTFSIYDITNNSHRLSISAAGNATFAGDVITSLRLKSIGADTNTNVTASSSHGISLQNTSNTDGNFIPIDFFNSTGFVTARIGAEFQDAGDRNTDLYFCTRANSGSLTEALRINSSQNATFAGSLTIPEYIIHAGDTDTKFGFAGVNDYRVHIGGSDRFRITGDVHVKGATDFAIPAGRKLYLDGQSNTYITESSADNIKFFTGGTEVLLLDSSQDATFAGNVTATNILTVAGAATGNPYLQFTQGGSQKAYIQYVDTGNDFVLQSDGSFRIYTGGTSTALTLDSSQNATFAGTIDSGTITSTGIVKTSTTFQSTGGSMLFFVPNVGQALEIAQNTGNATFAGNVSMPTGNSTGKFAVMSTAVHGSYDFYNNGTSYLNGTVIVDAAFSQTGGLASTFSGTVTIPSYVYHSGDPNTYFGFSGNDVFQVNTAGGERMRITASGMKLSTSGATVSVILDEDNMSSNSATALATQQSIKAYVDNSISGGANYLGVWDPDDSLNNGYGNPSLQASARTDTSGDYFICSADGAAHPNGGTTEPDSWHTGDWVVWNEDLGSSGLWQKIDNTTVLSGGGTTNKLPIFTDSETIGDSRFSQNSTTNIITGPGNAGSDKSLSVTSAANTEQLYIQGTGEVVVSQNYFYVAATQGMYSNGLARFRGGITNDQGNPLLLGGDGLVTNLTLTSNTSATFAGKLAVNGSSVFADAELDVLGDITLINRNWALRGNNSNADLAIEKVVGNNFDDNNIALTVTGGQKFVGIGTKNPLNRLVVSGIDTNAELNGTTVTQAALQLSNSDFAYGTFFGTLSSGTGLIQQRRQSTAVYYPLAINPYGGNVGIGTDSPNSKLDVRQAGDGIALELHNTGGNVDDFVDIKMIAGNTTAGTLGTILRHQRDGSGGGDFSILTNPTLTGTPTEKLIVKSGGNVGIGETSPKAKLNITGVSGGPTVPVANSSAGIVRIESSNGGVGLDIGAQSASPYSMWMQVGNTSNSSGDTYPILLNPLGGNVGIGTTNPAAQFNVQGTSTIGWSNLANARILAGSVTAGIGIDSNEIVSKGENLYIGTITSGTDIVMRAGGATSRLQISGTNGNVGIGTTSPDFKLDVDGTLGVSDLPFNSSSVSVLVANEITGVEEVTNGSFTTDADWNKNPNWTISGGTANADGTSNQDMNQIPVNGYPAVGEVFRVSFEITARTQGQVRIEYGDAVTDFVSAINQYEYILTAVSTDRIRIQCQNSFIGSVDNLSIKQITSASNQIQKRELSSDIFTSGPFLPLAGSVYDGNTGSWSNGVTGNLALVSASGTKGIIIGDEENGAGQLSVQFNSNNGGGILTNNGGNLEITAQNFGDGSDIIFKGNDTSNNLVTYFQTVGASQKVRFLDNIKLTIGNGDDLQIKHNGTDSYIENYTGDLQIVNYTDDKDIRFWSDNGSGGVTEYFRLDGGSVTNQFLKTVKLYDAAQLWIGDSNDLQIYHDGSNTHMVNFTGNLEITNDTNDGDIIFKSDDGLGGLTEYFRVDGGESNTIFSRDLKFLDSGLPSRKLVFGTNNDLTMFHDGGNSYIAQGGTGDLYIQQNVNDKDLVFQCDNGSGGTTAYFQLDGSHTQSIAWKDIHFVDGIKAKFGDYASPDLQIYHDGSNSYIETSSASAGDLYIKALGTNHDLYLQASDNVYIRPQNGEDGIIVVGDGGVQLYYNDVRKFETTNTGISVTGSLSTTEDISVSGDLMVTGTTTAGGTLICEGNITVQDSDKLQLGNSQDLELYHASGVSYIDNDTGHLYIRNNVDNDDGSNIYIQAKSGENSILCQDDGAVGLYNNNIQKFSTNSTGAGAYGYIGFGSAGTSTGSSYGFRYGSSSPSGSQGIVISVSDTGGAYFDGVGRFQNTNTGQGAGMFQMVNYGSLYGRYMQFFRGSTSNIIGYIGYNSSNTSVTFSTTNSDIRTKKNITTWDENVLDKFKALQPKRFDFKVAIGDKGAVKERGFIAQYEKDNFPEAYQLNGNDEKATYGFHPMEMVPYMMKAIKDLTIKNEELERRIKTLES